MRRAVLMRVKRRGWRMDRVGHVRTGRRFGCRARRENDARGAPGANGGRSLHRLTWNRANSAVRALKTMIKSGGASTHHAQESTVCRGLLEHGRGQTERMLERRRSRRFESAHICSVLESRWRDRTLGRGQRNMANEHRRAALAGGCVRS